MATDADDERAVLEVVEFSESEDEDFEYKAVEVKVRWMTDEEWPCIFSSPSSLENNEQ